MVRQAGGLYVLGELFRNDLNNKLELKGTIELAISYFEENSYAGSFNEQEFKCLLKTSEKCTLGGTSLLLVGIIDLVERDPTLAGQYMEIIENYKKYFVAMKIPNKGFRNAFYLEKSQSEDESPFGNGEAFLALVRYYKLTQDQEVKIIIDDSFEYFENIYRDDWDNNFYLWGMAAIKDLYAMDPKPEYFEFVKDYTDWRVNKYKNRRDSNHNRCAYIEGAISAYSVLEPNLTEDEKEYYLEEINFWLTKSSQLQVKSTDNLLIRFNDEMTERLKIENNKFAVGGFLTDTDEPVQRIDFTQHCLSSYWQKLVDIDGEEL
jgi:hypothetical protein